MNNNTSEEYIAIPKKEYEHLKAVKAEYLAELEQRVADAKAELMQANHANALSKAGIPMQPLSVEEFCNINNGILY